MEVGSEAAFKEGFEAKLLEYEEQHQGSQRKPWTQDKINEVINHIRRGRVAMKSEQRRTPMEYYWMSKYDILSEGDEYHLIFKKKSANDEAIRIMPRDEYFNVIKETHISLGHGGRDKIIYALKAKYYIPKKAIEIFVALCPTCEMKKNVPKKSLMGRPTVTQDFNISGHVELVDFQSCADGDYKWLLCYEDNASKFMSLRPLKSTESKEVALELMKIFMVFGAPCTLQFDSDTCCAAKVIEELNAMWPECKIVHETPQAHGIIETSHQDIEKRLHQWMNENKSSKWSLGCHFIQYQRNTSFQYRIGKTAYKALFGSNPQNTVAVPETEVQLIVNIKTEKQLKREPEEDSTDTTPSAYINSTPKIEHHDIEPAGEVTEQKKIIKSEKSIVEAYEDSCEDAYSSTSYDYADNADDNLPRNSQKRALSESSLEESEAHRSKLLCVSCKRDVNIEVPNNQCVQGTKSAEETTHNSPKAPPPLQIGETVLIKVAKVGRDPLAAKNIKGKITDIQNGVYRVGTNAGTLKNWFATQDLQLLSEDYSYNISDTPISLQEAVAHQSALNLRKCSCKPARNQCHNNRCACFKNNASCGSQCHGDLSCVNK